MLSEEHSGKMGFSREQSEKMLSVGEGNDYVNLENAQNIWDEFLVMGNK